MHQSCSDLDKIITQSQSANKQAREQAQATITALRLDGSTTQILLQYITENYKEDNRLAVAVAMKNIVKQVYGVSMADL
jgi:multidrug efflux pump subunit AcrA (membrane-fusion protein)